MMKIRLNFTKPFLLLLVFLFVFVFAESVYADTWEYITHGGYDAAVEAWKRVALIFSHSGYAGLFTVAFILSFFSLLAGFLLKSAFGLKVPVHTWLSYLLAAAVIYLALIVPKDSIVIYDETLNRGPYQVDGVPRLLATLAGVINKAENGMIELVGEASDPVQDYRYNPAGIAFNALGSVKAKQLPSYKYLTLYNYFKDCIVPSAEAGSYLRWDDLTSGRYNFAEAITQSANPSLYTVVYNSDGSDYTASCKEASTVALNYIGNIDAFDKALKGGCARAGYDPDSTASYQMCKNMMDSSAAFLLQQAGITTSTDLLGVIQQMLFVNITKDYLLNNGPAALGAYLATQKTTGSFIGLGIHANSWIPELKESLSAVVIALTPLILLFLITPFALRALSVLAGMLIWIAMWGVIDAVVFSFGLSMASASAKYLATGSVSEGLGLFAASLLPNTTAKIYAIFGALRWSGLMLASVLTTMLVRFGGTALAMLAGQIASAPMSAGAAMGSAMSTSPVQTMESSLVPSETWANTAFAMGGMRNIMNAMAKAQAAEMTGKAQFASEKSFSELAKASQAEAQYSYLKKLSTHELLQRFSEKDIISGEAGRGMAGLVQGMTQYQAGSSLLEQKSRMEMLNELGKTLSREVLMDYLQNGKLSEQTILKLNTYSELSKTLTGSDSDILSGHHQSISFNVNSSKDAVYLSNLLGTPISIGDKVSLDYALHKTDDGRYVVDPVKAEMILTGEKEFSYNGHSYHLQDVEMKQIGDYREISKGTLLVGSGSAITLDQRKGMVLNQGVLTELHGGFRGSWEDFQAFAEEHGWWNNLRTDSRALKAIRETIENGEMVNINYDRGHLLITAGGNVLFEKTGKYVSKESVDTLSTYKSGSFRQHLDYSETKTGSAVISESKVIADHGTDQDSWFVFVHNPDSRIAREHFHRMITDKGYRDQSLIKLANDLNIFHQRKLSDRGYGEADVRASGGVEASLGPKIFGTGVQIKGSLSGNIGTRHQTVDKREYDFNVQQVYNLWDKAYQETVKEFGGIDYSGLSAAEKVKFEEKLGERFYDSVSQTYKDYVDWIKNQDVNNYGATAYGSRAMKVADKLGEKGEEIWENLNKDFTYEERTKFIEGKAREGGIVEPPNLPNVEPKVVSLPNKKNKEE